MKNITIRDSGNKEVLEAYFLNHEGQPYNLENKTVTFMENKDGDKFVSDPNVQIVNATAGFVRYTLQSQVHSAPGIAWFEINDDSGLVDSTGNFNIRVENGLRATADNTTYIGALEKLKQQMEALIQQADGELKTELQRAEQQLNQELQNFRNQYNSLSADFQNQFKTAQNARQQDYNNQKNAINQDWTNNKNSIWEQWNNDKANIDKQAQDTVQAIKDNAKQVLDKDQANWNAKQTQWDSTFSAIVKEWQVKTNSLNATVQDLTNKFNTIIGQVSDLMNNKIPTINAKADAVNKKIDEWRATLSQVDWNSFAKDRTFTNWIYWAGHNWVMLNQDMTTWTHNREMSRAANVSYDSNTHLNTYDYTGVSGIECSRQDYYGLQPNENYRIFFSWKNLKQLSRLGDSRYCFRVLVYEKNNPNNVLGYQDLPVEPCDKTLFQVTFNTHDVKNITIELNTGGLTDGIHYTWQIGNWFLAPIDIEPSTITISNNTDLNNVKVTNFYRADGITGIKNSPVASRFELSVIGSSYNGSQTLYDTNTGRVYARTWNSTTFSPWKALANIDEVNARLPLSGGNMQKGSWIKWSGNGEISAVDGQIGGIMWEGATDNIKIFGDNNVSDNLDLAIQLGDDNSNHISFRDKDGAERAAITADGQFTGRTNWANVMNTGIDNPTLGRYISRSNTWNDIIGQDNGKKALAAIRDESNGQGNTLGNFSSGIVFGGGDTKGMLNVAYDSPRARIIGGNGNAPVWKKDIAWKDDLKVNVVRSYDIEKNQAGPVTSETLGGQRLVDQGTLTAFADAHRDVRNHTDFRYPTGIDQNTSVNLNSNAYGETGIYKFVNCVAINGPWTDLNQRQYFYMNTIRYDDNSIYQLIFRGAEVYARTISERVNSYPGWSTFATMDSITDLSDRLQGFTMQLRGFTMQQTMFQHRVDYESPSGTISNQTVDFNNYRETGILKVVNCLIQNGPYKSENRHTLFLKITNLDGQTQYQTVYEGDNLYGRKLYNGSGQWHKYTNTPI